MVRPADDPSGAAPRVRATVLSLMVSPRIVRGALRVSLAVGTVLNVINNGERLWFEHTVDPWRLLLNYVVPFCVSSYSAARNEAQRAARPGPGED